MCEIPNAMLSFQPVIFKQCPVCGKTFEKQESYEEHYRNKHLSKDIDENKVIGKYYSFGYLNSVSEILHVESVEDYTYGVTIYVLDEGVDSTWIEDLDDYVEISKDKALEWINSWQELELEDCKQKMKDERKRMGLL